MNKHLVLSAFAKAEKELRKEGKNKPSLTEQATHLSVQLEEHMQAPIGERRLRDYRKQALASHTADINIAQAAVIDALCQYVGFDNYAHFCKDHNAPGSRRSKGTGLKSTDFALLNKWMLLIPIILLAGVFIYNQFTRQRWMTWQQDHYIEVDFDDYKYRVKELKVYQQDRMASFKKVKVTCDTVFFNPDGSARFWYYKTPEKELECYTDLGRHPKTGKSLKPITQYMIDKYICSK